MYHDVKPLPKRKSIQHVTVASFRGSESHQSFDVSLILEKCPDMTAARICFTQTRRSLGYLSFANVNGRLVLRGMQVTEGFRGLGLSTIFFAVWLDLCSKLGALPCTMLIDKPLICLVLQKFGFVPVHRTLVAELSLDDHECGSIVLWSENMKQLQSLFSKVTRKNQHIVLADARPISSKTIHLGTTFEAPDPALWREFSGKLLDGKLEYCSPIQNIGRHFKCYC